ncbi:MAG: DMT family transporter [Candidatus Paceibacterota bacterium]|jgi:drug/metabolite transporter (DMT)-like permease
MDVSVGIGLAFVAMLCWGFGDFLIQKSTRKVGDWETLFVICGFGALILLPFVWRDLPAILSGDGRSLLILLGTGIILFIAALFDFEALKKGKLAVVEPIWSLEVPAAAILAFLILDESITLTQGFLIAALIIGLILVSIHTEHSLKKFLLEKGVLIAFFAAFIMGAANFFYGWGARVSDPLMINFFVNVFVTVATTIYLVATKKFGKTLKDAISYRSVLLPMSIFDNAAWIAFAFAMSLAPIAIATALSESYILVAVILGLAVNRERIDLHQKFGLVIALISAIILAVVTV